MILPQRLPGKVLDSVGKNVSLKRIVVLKHGVIGRK